MEGAPRSFRAPHRRATIDGYRKYGYLQLTRREACATNEYQLAYLIGSIICGGERTTRLGSFLLPMGSVNVNAYRICRDTKLSKT